MDEYIKKVNIPWLEIRYVDKCEGGFELKEQKILM